ncbi:MAG: hypothetical protein QXP36_07660 [Conexivisphaerales archaeon]
MKKIKKMEKIGLAIAGIIGIGEIAYFYSKFQQQQPPSQQPTPPPTQPPNQPPSPPQPKPPQPVDLEIKNYNLSFDHETHNIIAIGTVYLNGQPKQNAIVDMGFCSNYYAIYETSTDKNGNFKGYIYTGTPPGGQNCIFAETSIANKKAIVSKTITIPW